MARLSYDPEVLSAGVLAGDRRSLSQAITCIESKRSADGQAAEALLARLLPHAGRACRIGITGIPGAGKSTLIEALGLHILAQDPEAKIAVLAVDPTSARAHGSLMADKVRMAGLSSHPRAYIRPSPSGLSPGGMARGTQEAMLLCEAAGYGYLFVETVGVGQTEIAVRQVVDCVLVLVLAGTGDQWQGLKRGIIEIADLLLIHKADRDRAQAAHHALRQYQATMSLIASPMPDWQVPVLACSSADGTGIAALWETILRFFEHARASGYLAQCRKRQRITHLHQCLFDCLHEALQGLPAYKEAQAALATGTVLPRKLAKDILNAYLAS